MEDDCSIETDSISSNDYCESVQDDIPVNIKIPIDENDDLVTKQRKRRLRRMEILKRKRQRVYSSTKSNNKRGSNASLDDISDPKLLRKLRNREAAERSRRRVTETIDTLTFQVCEHYVLLQDMEQQYYQLLNNGTNGVCSTAVSIPASYASSVTSSPLPSDAEGRMNTYSPFSGCSSPVCSELTDDDSCSDMMQCALMGLGNQPFSADFGFDETLQEVLQLFC